MTSRYSSNLSLLVFFLSLLLAVAACSGPEGNPQNGEKWFAMNNCSSCHGPHGNDGRAVNIAGLSMSYSRFVRKLRASRTTIMPTFPESRISDQDAADIYAYLKSVPAEARQQ